MVHFCYVQLFGRLRSRSDCERSEEWPRVEFWDVLNADIRNVDVQLEGGLCINTYVYIHRSKRGLLRRQRIRLFTQRTSPKLKVTYVNTFSSGLPPYRSTLGCSGCGRGRCPSLAERVATTDSRSPEQAYF